MKTLVHELRENGIAGNPELERLAIQFAIENSYQFEQFVEDLVLSDAQEKGDEQYDMVYDSLLND